MNKQLPESLDSHIHQCQGQASDIAERLEAVAMLLQNFQPENEIDPSDIKKIGWLIQDYTEKCRQLASKLDSANVAEIKEYEEFLSKNRKNRT